MIRCLKLLLLLLIFGCSKPQIEYNDFLQYRKDYDEGQSSKEQFRYEDAINYLKNSDNSIDNFPAPKLMAECHMLLKNKDEALKMLSLAFKRGFPITSIDKKLFNPIWSDVKEAYGRESSEYHMTVDTVLRNKLNNMILLDQTNRWEYESHRQEFIKIDSININELRKICIEKGWPGRKILGYGRIPDPSILVIHSNEKNNLYFLDIAMKASLNNEASWFGTRAIMYNLLWRFDHDGYSKLRNTYLKEDGELDLESKPSMNYILLGSNSSSLFTGCSGILMSTSLSQSNGLT